MLKKTIAYTDYNGEKREEDFYFNLNKAELAEMELSRVGGMETTLKKLIAEKNQEEIVRLFKGIILKSYGEKSVDGKRFVKSEELSNEFSQTEAYAELFIELLSNEEKAAEFVNGILPQDVKAEVQKEIANKQDVNSK